MRLKYLNCTSSLDSRTLQILGRIYTVGLLTVCIIYQVELRFSITGPKVLVVLATWRPEQLFLRVRFKESQRHSGDSFNFKPLNQKPHLRLATSSAAYCSSSIVQGLVS